MASATYLRVDGIDGEVKAAGYEKAIEIASFSYTCSQLTDPRSGGAGRTTHGMVYITKKVDTTTPVILKIMWSGNTLPKAILHSSADHLTMTMENVVFASYALVGTHGAAATEEIALNFSKISVVHEK